MRQLFVTLSACSILFLSACNDETPSDSAVFTGLGQIQGTANIVDSLLLNVQANDSINYYFSATFADSNRALSFRNHLIDQFCELSGGPCHYNGKIMSEAHKNMQITEEQYNYLLSDLQAALIQNAIPTDIQDQFFIQLAPLKGQIIEK